MIYSFDEQLFDANLLFVKAIINNYILTFDIDSGSSYNIIFHDAYEFLKDSFEKTDKSGNVFGIDGKYQESPMVSTNLYFDDNAYKTDFQVINALDAASNIEKEFGIQLHGILGVQFLKDNNCVIDFANKTIKIGE